MNYNKKLFEYIFNSENFSVEEISVMYYTLAEVIPSVTYINNLGNLPIGYREFFLYAQDLSGVNDVSKHDIFINKCSSNRNYVIESLSSMTVNKKIKYMWLFFLFISHMQILGTNEYQMKIARDYLKVILLQLGLSEDLQHLSLQDFKKMFNNELRLFLNSVE